MTSCVVCGKSAKAWRAFMPYANYSARIGWLCSEHANITSEEFHTACVALPENSDIAAYQARNRKAIEQARAKAEQVSQLRRAAIAKRWSRRASDRGDFVSERRFKAGVAANRECES